MRKSLLLLAVCSVSACAPALSNEAWERQEPAIPPALFLPYTPGVTDSLTGGSKTYFPGVSAPPPGFNMNEPEMRHPLPLPAGPEIPGNM
jgi:hypothetical protein